MALGLTEPRGGSDAGNLILKAERDDKDYVLNGEKTSISLVAQADSIILLARTGNAGRLAASPASSCRSTCRASAAPRSTIWASKIIGRGSVFFDNVHIPAEYKIGDEGTGFRQVMQGFDYSRALIGLQVLAPA